MKNKDLIPIGMYCYDKDGTPCPYFKLLGEVSVNRTNCVYKNECNKNCSKKGCKNVFATCTFFSNDSPIQNFTGKENLLAHKIKICGINISKKSN